MMMMMSTCYTCRLLLLLLLLHIQFFIGYMYCIPGLAVDTRLLALGILAAPGGNI